LYRIGLAILNQQSPLPSHLTPNRVGSAQWSLLYGGKKILLHDT
jgi:hypothetical protein